MGTSHLKEEDGGWPAVTPLPLITAMEIDSTQVLHLIQQFLQEHGLSKSLQSLEEECGVPLNVIERPEAFRADCLAGRWDSVLTSVSPLKLPSHVLQMVYEEVVRELVECGETDAARSVLRGVLPMVQLRGEDSDAYARLEAMVSQGAYGGAGLGGGGGGGGGAVSLPPPTPAALESRRGAVARAVLEHTTTPPPSRLLVLLGQALKWQVHTGQLSPYALSSGSSAPDLLRGGVTTRVIRDEAPVRSVLGGFTLSYGSGPARPAVGIFTLDGTMLILGGGDGLIEIYDAGGVGGGGEGSGAAPKLSPLCPYQARDEFLVHEDGITALAASRDGELLASASRDGEIKVWRIKSGECLRKFMGGGGGGGGGGGRGGGASAVVALAFTGDGGTLLAGGVDGVGRLWGLRSGKCLAELRGHGAHITGAVFVDGGGVGEVAVTGSADGTVRLWDGKSGEEMGVVRPGGSGGGGGNGSSGSGSGSGSGSSGGDLSGVSVGAALGNFPPIAALLPHPHSSTPGAFFVLCTRASGGVIDGKEGGKGGGDQKKLQASMLLEGLEGGGGTDAAPTSTPPSLFLVSALSGAILTSFSHASALSGGGGGSGSGSGSSGGGGEVAGASPLTHAALSPQGKYVYAGGEDRKLYAWDTSSATLLHYSVAPLHEKPLVGLLSHPHRPALLTWGEEGTVKCWGQ